LSGTEACRIGCLRATEPARIPSGLRCQFEPVSSLSPLSWRWAFFLDNIKPGPYSFVDSLQYFLLPLKVNNTIPSPWMTVLKSQ
jgi:hypothetical protein